MDPTVLPLVLVAIEIHMVGKRTEMLFYCPQTKVMFLHLCVILFTGGGLGLCLGGLCLGVSIQGVSFQGGLCPGGSPSRVVSVQGGLCPGERGLCPGGLCLGGLCLGVSVQGGLPDRGLCLVGLCLGGSLSRGLSVRETLRHMVMSGRYASYWNAFLCYELNWSL